MAQYLKTKPQKNKEHAIHPSQEVITDHAIVRYLERYYDLDIKKLRQELLTDEMKAMIKFGAEGIKAHNGIWKVRDGRIVTFIAAKG